MAVKNVRNQGSDRDVSTAATGHGKTAMDALQNAWQHTAPDDKDKHYRVAAIVNALLALADAITEAKA